MMVQVEFHSSDIKSPGQLRAAEAMAKFVYEHQEYMEKLCDVIRISYTWKIADYKQKLERRIDNIHRKRVKSDEDTSYIKYLTNLYGQCKSDEDIQDVRGMVPEEILRQIWKHHPQKRSWKVCKRIPYYWGRPIFLAKIYFVCPYRQKSNRYHDAAEK